MQALPHVLTDRRQRLQVYETTAVQDAAQQMTVAVQQLSACVAELRESGDIIEGAVLLLGVPTAHTLLTQLNHSMGAIQTVAEAWRATAAVQLEHVSQYRLLTASMEQAYNTMRERRDGVERELRALRSERDRKDAAFDKAVDYVQRVLAEHTKWQEACGYNTQQWPVVGACEDAMTALNTARVAAAAEGNGKAKVAEMAGDAANANRPSLSVVAARVPPGSSRVFPAPPLREWALPAADSSEDKADVAQRWSATAASWQHAAQPSVRFAYIPPAEEVRLLHDVLAMGTGSTTLMKEIQDEAARFAAGKEKVRAECGKHLAALRGLREELATLKAHLRELVERHTPFTSMSDELMRRLHMCIDAEVARRVAISSESLYRNARASEVEYAATGSLLEVSLQSASAAGDGS